MLADIQVWSVVIEDCASHWLASLTSVTYLMLLITLLLLTDLNKKLCQPFNTPSWDFHVIAHGEEGDLFSLKKVISNTPLFCFISNFNFSTITLVALKGYLIMKILSSPMCCFKFCDFLEKEHVVV